MKNESFSIYILKKIGRDRAKGHSFSLDPTSTFFLIALLVFGVFCATILLSLSDPSGVMQYLKYVTSPGTPKLYHCLLCGKTSEHGTTMRRHMVCVRQINCGESKFKFF